MSAVEPSFVLAVPSKGRLQENAAAFFARAGLDLVQGRGARDYRGTLADFPGLEIAYLPVSEIVTQIADGRAHMGVLGEDLLREQVPDADNRAVLLAPLGFGHANVVVAVPQAWIDVRTMADIEDVAAVHHARHGRRMRVATKYPHLTRAFFARKGVTDYRIVESLGATEGAPTSGTAEFIVDITTTGTTLAANGLKVLEDGVILRSEANLVSSLRAPWPESIRRTARSILSRIAAEEKARTTREVRATFRSAPSDLRDAVALFDAVPVRSGTEAVRSFHCPVGNVAALADWLIEHDADHATVTPLNYLFAARNPLFEALAKRLASLEPGTSIEERAPALPALP